MKKRIVAFILAFFITVIGCGFSIAAEAPSEIKEKEIIIEEDNIVCSTPNVFTVERIEEFIDDKLNTYSIDELEILIQEKLSIQEEAHKLAAAAKKLGWPETSDSIISAKAEWWNAQMAIEVYSARIEEINIIWEAKKAEYPVATEIWLFMKDLGWNDYVCAGIMGNLMTEVGGQTLNIQYWLYNGKNYYGMCQWSREYRGEIWGGNLVQQCAFLRDTIEYEFNTFGKCYAKNFDYEDFLQLTDEQEAAKAFAKCYERCSFLSYSVRQKNATKAYDYFVNN